jgi:hypothetical protein
MGNEEGGSLKEMKGRYVIDFIMKRVVVVNKLR